MRHSLVYVRGACLATLLGCSDPSQGVIIQFDPENSGGRVDEIEVAVLNSCDGATADGYSQAHAVERFQRGKKISSIGKVKPGTYGLYARAFNAGCTVGFGCDTVQVGDDPSDDISVVIHFLPAPRCPVGACALPGGSCADCSWRCQDSECRVPTQLSLGPFHSCVLDDAGAVVCWGSNSNGELGDGTMMMRTSPVQVCGIRDATFVSTGGGHTCAVRKTGEVMCWGLNSSGQLGDGTQLGSPLPVRVRGISDAVRVAAGSNYTCAQTQSGRVLCWGFNRYGLGDGVTTDSASPVEVFGISDAKQIAAGQEFACVLLNGGEVACWGRNSSGQLGDGTVTNNTRPVSVLFEVTADVQMISAGSQHMCAIRSDGQTLCWGNNARGQVGTGSAGGVQTRPVSVSGIGSAHGIGAGSTLPSRQPFDHSCLVLGSGGVSCWGANDQGQLGNSSTVDSASPVPVGNLSPATSVALGALHTCAITQDRAVFCWGNNTGGQLGTGDVVSSTTPRLVTRP